MARRREHAVVPRQVGAGLGYQRGEPRDRDGRAFGYLRPRCVRLRRQRLQRENLLALSPARRDPVADRRPEQAVDRRLLARIEGEIGRGLDAVVR